MTDRQQFIQSTQPLLIATLTKSFQNETPEKIKSTAAKAICMNADLIYGVQDASQESKISGVTFPLKKSKKESYQTLQDYDFKSTPFIVVECYTKEHKFIEMQIHTLKDVLDDPEKYDTRAFTLLMEKLSNSYGVDQVEKLKLIIELASKLKTRVEEERKEAEKNKEVYTIKPMEPSNYDLKKRFLFGKSILSVDVAELATAIAGV
jgi:hypothetical protein